MRRLATFIALLLLLSTAAPMLTCMTGSAMTREESACCRAMHGQCGEMTRMGCCRTEMRSVDLPQIATVSPVVIFDWTVIAQPVPVALSIGTKPSAIRRIPMGYLPPGTLGVRTTILRI